VGNLANSWMKTFFTCGDDIDDTRSFFIFVVNFNLHMLVHIKFESYLHILNHKFHNIKVQISKIHILIQYFKVKHYDKLKLKYVYIL
jgi:hypothetical protein